jgi:hypothetical protein
MRFSKGDEARRIVFNIANFAEMMQRSRDQQCGDHDRPRGNRNTGEHAGREDEEVAHSDLRGTARRWTFEEANNAYFISKTRTALRCRTSISRTSPASRRLLISEPIAGGES